MKSFSKFIVWLLLALMPLQVLAASNMRVCNGMMQVTVITEHAYAQMPCHEQLDGASEVMQDQKSSNPNLACESHCAALCASLNVLSMLYSDLSPANYLAAFSTISLPDQNYSSVTQTNLLRPPIFLI